MLTATIFAAKACPSCNLLWPLYSSRDSIFLRPLSMLYFKSVAILMQGITNNLAPHNILRGLFNTTPIKYMHMFITILDLRQEVITKLNFQDWITKAIIFKIGGHNMELHTSEYRKNPKAYL